MQLKRLIAKVLHGHYRFKVWMAAAILVNHFLLPALSQGKGTDDITILKVIINTEDKGVFFLERGNGDDFFVTKEDFKKIGFKEIPVQAVMNKEGAISLKSLSPAVEFNLREEDPAIILSVAPVLLEKSVIDLSREKKNVTSHMANDNSLFLNYNINYNVSENSDFKNLSVPLELGTSTGPLLSYTGFVYNKAGNREEIIRLMSNITIDRPQSLRRYVLGDFTASSGGGFGSSGVFGGLSISKNFSLSPYSIRMPQFNLSGILETPSQVDVYVNDIFVTSESLSAGEFEFKNLPSYSNIGNTVLIIKDAYGRERKIVSPFILSASQLSHGVHEYSYNIGFKRENLGQRESTYRDLSIIVYHRTGITDYLTFGLRGEGERERYNGGATASLLMGLLGSINTSIAISSFNGQSGYGIFSDYFNSRMGLTLRLTVNTFSEKYSTLSTFHTPDDSELEGVASIGFSNRILGAFSATYNLQRTHSGFERKNTTLAYSRNLFNYASFFINGMRSEDRLVSDVVMVGLNFSFGSNSITNMERRIQEGSSTTTLNFNKSSSEEIGRSYTFRVEKSEQDEQKDMTNEDGTIRYNGRYGTYFGQFSRSQEINNYFFSYSGSLVFIDKSFFFTRPIYDGFALVKVGELRDVEVMIQNRKAGVTNSKGKLLVPGLTSYFDNEISIATENIPIDYTLEEKKKYISLPYKSGGKVEFDVHRFQAVEGSVFFLKDGKKISADFGGLELTLKGKPTLFSVGKSGQIYVEDISSGKYPAKLFNNETECTFDLIVPKSDEVIINLGDQPCKLN